MRLPLNGFVKDNAIGSIVSSEGVALVLHTKHDERRAAIVAYRTYTSRCHAHYAALANGEYLAIYLELPFAAQEKVELFVCFVSVKKACFGARLEHLE